MKLLLLLLLIAKGDYTDNSGRFGPILSVYVKPALHKPKFL